MLNPEVENEKAKTQSYPQHPLITQEEYNRAVVREHERWKTWAMYHTNQKYNYLKKWVSQKLD